MFRHTDSGFDQRIRWQKSTSSGNVGTQYPNDVGSEWFGTIENLNAGLAQGKVHWSDVYKTDVLWTTPSAATGGPLRSDPRALFEEQYALALRRGRRRLSENRRCSWRSWSPSMTHLHGMKTGEKLAGIADCR